MIPKNTPAIAKYLPLVVRNDPAHFKACIEHGMRYGKLQRKALEVEQKCLHMLNAIIDGSPDIQHRLLFEVRTAYAESAKCRPLYWDYMQGNGVEIGSGGWPMVPHAIQVELTHATYDRYNSGNIPEFPIQYRTDGDILPFMSGTMDWCASSHLLEDFLDWTPKLQEWARIIKRGGHLVILIPDKQRWDAAMRRGQPPNCAHKHEGYPGELSIHVARLGFQVIKDELAFPDDPEDYNIIFIAQKL